MTSHRRLTAASSLISVTLLVGGPNLAVALADSHSGGNSHGNSGSSHSNGSGGSGRGSGSNGGASGGSTHNKPSGGSSSGSSSGSGSGSGSSSGSGSTGSSSAPGTSGSGASGSTSTPKTGAPNPLAGIAGQINRTINKVTGALTGGLPGGAASVGGGPKNSKNTPTGSPKPTKPPTPRAGVTPSGDSTPDTNAAGTTNTPSGQSATPAKVSIPNMAVQLPLTALDALKAEIPVVAAAIPLPGMSALPAIADAIITPLQQAVKSWANAANGLPFMQIDLNQVPPASTLSGNRFLRTAPVPGVKPKSSGPDPLPLNNDLRQSPATPLDMPIEPVKPKQTFSASSHFSAAQEFRPGYPDYLRAAGMSEVAAVAVPGFAGILTITCAGGLLGYRQARAGRSTAPSRAARFVN